MDDLRFHHNVRSLDFRKFFKDGRPFSNLFFPARLIDIEFASAGHRRDRILLGKIRDLFAAGFVLNESALAGELFDGLFVRRIGGQPQVMTDAFVIIFNDRPGSNPGRRLPLEGRSRHEFRVVEIVGAHADLRLQVPSDMAMRFMSLRNRDVVWWS